ncbi:class D beta-lactamase [Pseudomonas sp. S9]|uniref:class D beta-lactamase n=1 Tax=Pseudomonas sp. S9 TaxID=686578 RepID=UPI0002F7584C|nr:class D beta-lactamase [Pseudomonas sp. S9]
MLQQGVLLFRTDATIFAMPRALTRPSIKYIGMKMKLLHLANTLLAGLTLVAACAAQAQTKEVTVQSADLDQLFAAGNVKGTFVLFDPQQNKWLYHDEKRANTQYLPASTFKIPNSLIALETKVASGPNFELDWDSVKNPRQSWWPDSWAKKNTLHTALQNSVVWYYQEIARRIGQKRMQSYVDQFSYGNRNISGGIDQFWLTGGLRISAKEQVDFLQRFYGDKLGASEASTRTVKKMIVLEETPNYRLSGKSGWAGLGEKGAPQTGWLVGYLERGKNVYFYAINIDIKKSEDAAKRMTITKEVFKKMALL